ncbi:MAG: HAD-IA family hydrolase [Paracoccus sp. (in: a-proteobacteria)]|nr:HAD-IA family hydrolase [Paracoccus sp. (in: a-proteobacteria)]
MRLVIFDVDGTLVDSQALIVGCMNDAMGAAGLPALPREEVLSIVGLSLEIAIARLLPGADAATVGQVADGYRLAYHKRRLADEAPLYEGARDCLDLLAGRDDLLLGIATGKSRRGLDGLIATHGLEGRFVTLQTADFHPSKPNPAMIEAALSETGTAPGDAVMIGDTLFDMEMAANAGIARIGVAWGYHAATDLAAAGAPVARDFAELTRMIKDWA